MEKKKIVAGFTGYAFPPTPDGMTDLEYLEFIKKGLTEKGDDFYEELGCGKVIIPTEYS